MDENKRQPMVDLDYRVDRTYMTNRHQSQFIGHDLTPRLHLTIKDGELPNFDSVFVLATYDGIAAL
jgi:hypothetical protein